MNIKRNNSGFTLLEVIIVIIIVGVLASLALPRLFATVEFSRGSEALSAISSIRSSMERCYLANNGSYVSCVNFNQIDLADPQTSPGAHFSYGIVGAAANYTITATRLTNDGGTATSTIVFTQNGTTLTKSGTTAFQAIK